MTPTETANIMVVDDQPTNLKLLEDMLSNQGYAVRSFPRGRLALASAAQSPPDLILLDINMPEMSGFEVCHRLKSEPALARIPVIFLSALNETEDKVKALRSGGVDYVTKPFQIAEIQARVETHLELHRLRLALERHRDHLEETVRARTLELAEAHARLRILDRSKSEFLHLISHELRTPLNGLLGVTEVLCADPQSEDAPELREMFEVSRARVLRLLDHALLLTQIEVEGEKFVRRPVPLAAVLDAAMEQAAEASGALHATLERSPDTAVSVVGAHDLLVTAFRALLKTAVKFSEAGGAVRIACQAAPDTVQVAIASHGRTLPDALVPKFFELFAIDESATSGGDLGLDPPTAQRILSLFGGSVGIRNLDPPGIEIAVSLRRAAA